MRLVFSVCIEIILPAAFIAIGLMIAFRPDIYERWVRWSRPESYVPKLAKHHNVHSLGSRLVGVVMAVFGIAAIVLTVYIHWFQ